MRLCAAGAALRAAPLYAQTVQGREVHPTGARQWKVPSHYPRQTGWSRAQAHNCPRRAWCESWWVRRGGCDCCAANGNGRGGWRRACGESRWARRSGTALASGQVTSASSGCKKGRGHTCEARWRRHVIPLLTPPSYLPDTLVAGVNVRMRFRACARGGDWERAMAVDGHRELITVVGVDAGAASGSRWWG
ncbi:hypothetical protein BJ912DRAFT_1120679 [Pholiota molesta]|nr:hypothetical protein BJ912DRAFT_1120679 [Pholiota molesta]